MAKFRILWVDDDWADNAKDLLSDRKRILEELSNQQIDVSIKTESTVADAVVEVGRDDIEYRLVIIDLVFHEQRYEVEPLFSRLSERRIPYVIFTSFIDKLDEIMCHLDENNLLIGQFEKSIEGRIALSQSIVLFFNSLPVRILHLSDLHFDSTLTNDIDKEERDALFNSLIDTIGKESKRQHFDSVVICGDISMYSPDKDLVEARSLIKRINIATVNDLNRLAIVPGNHDILWNKFKKKELADRPLQPYLEFYHAIYGQKINILNELEAWDSRQDLFNPDSDCDQLSWFRYLPSSGLSLIGLSTVSLIPRNQGNGYFSRQHQKFFQEHWSDNINHEVRIALMHHNLYASLSLNRKSETRVLENSGEAMYSLMSAGCTCVLSGHTHSVNYIQCKASRMGLNGFANLNSFDAITGGTTGGVHIVGDRPRSFNVIDFSHCKKDTMKRTITISPFLYDSDEHEWKEKESLTNESE